MDQFMIEHNPQVPIIAISAPAGAGKGVIAQHLEENYGFQTAKFAACLKNMIAVLLLSAGVATPDNMMDFIEGDLKEVPLDKFGGKSPRYLMQTLGTEWGRDIIMQNLWLSVWQCGVLALNAPVVNDDLRFDNEADTVRGMGGNIIHLYRKDLARDAGDHSSESGITVKPTDITIFNDGSIQDLKDKVDVIMRARLG